MKHRSNKFALIGAAICVVSAAGMRTASAQTAAPPAGQGPSLRVACGADMQRFCPGLKGKDARLCLRAYHAQISAGCTAFLEEAKARRAAGATGAPPAAGGPPPGGSPPGGKDE
jgi:hypothetical protein